MRKFLTLFFFFACSLVAKEPPALYLTWLHDPTTTMTVQWHFSAKDKPAPLFYREKEEREWHFNPSENHPLSNSNILVFVSEITQLKPDTEYVFRFGQNGADYRFRTMPASPARPIRFIIGGDAYYSIYLFRKMNEQVAKLDPDFIVLGGDIAYTQNYGTLFKGADWEVKRWQTFFAEWKRQMVTPDGRLIPMLPVLGNHDIKISDKDPSRKGIHFYELFAFPKANTAFRVLDFGDYLSLFLLDTGHDFPIAGQQTAWLDQALSDRKHRPYKFAAYHIAAYPSAYSFDKTAPARIRRFWVPLFEEYGLQAAFEHHNHTFKRTFKLKNNQIDPTGILYLGDGSWGTPPRHPKKAWYLEKSASSNAIWLAILQSDQCNLKAIDIKGLNIDDLSISPSLVSQP